MLRTTTLSVAALLGAAMLTPTAASAAAGETCHGQPATIVGTERATPVIGTDGPDVIVVTGVSSAETLERCEAMGMFHACKRTDFWLDISRALA